MAKWRGGNPHEHEADYFEEPICERPRSGWEIGDNTQPWLLIRALLTQRWIHWLDGFLIFDEWKTDDQRGRYPQLFASLVSKARRILEDSHIDNANIRQLSRRRRFWQLDWHLSHDVESMVVEGVRLAKEACKAFRNDDLSGWDSLREAHQKWLDPTIISEAVVLAPGLPDNVAVYNKCLCAIKELLRKREKDIVLAFDKVSDLICQPDSPSGVTFKAAEDVFPCWVDELFCVQEAIKRLEGCALPEFGATDQFLNEFVALVNDYYELHQDLLAGKYRQDTVQQDIAQQEEEGLLSQLYECHIMMEAVEDTVQYFEELRYKKITQEDVRDSRDDAIKELVRDEGFPIKARRSVLGRLCMFLRKCAERRRRACDFRDICNDEASTYASKRQRVLGVLAIIEGKAMPRALTRPIALGLTKAAGTEEDGLALAGVGRTGRFKCLELIEDVLKFDSTPDAEPFRKLGPQAIDFEKGWVYWRTKRLRDLKKRVLGQLTSILEGESATGKTVLALTLAYDLSHNEHVPVYYFRPIPKLGFDAYDLAHEINSETGVFILEDAHLANAQYQLLCQKIKHDTDRHVLFVGRFPFRKSLLLSRVWDVKEEELLALLPFDDVDQIIDNYAKHKPKSGWPAATREAIKRISSKSFWLLTYALQGYVDAERKGDAKQWLADGVKQDLRGLAELQSSEEPYAYQYPKILVALSPLYKNEVSTAEKYLIEVLHFDEPAFVGLVRRGEIVRQESPEGHVFYGLPHSGLADAYWEHGLEYRVQLKVSERTEFIVEYVASRMPNGLNTIIAMDKESGENALQILGERGDLSRIIENERSLRFISYWLSIDGRLDLSGWIPDDSLIETLARRINKAGDVSDKLMCIAGVFGKDIQGGRRLWSLLDTKKLGNQLTEAMDILGVMTEMLNICLPDYPCAEEMWMILNTERLADRIAQHDDPVTIGRIFVCLRAINPRLIENILGKIDVESLARRVSHLSDASRIAFCLNYFSGITDGEGIEFWQLLDCNAIARSIDRTESRRQISHFFLSVFKSNKTLGCYLLTKISNPELKQVISKTLETGRVCDENGPI